MVQILYVVILLMLGQTSASLSSFWVKQEFCTVDKYKSQQ